MTGDLLGAALITFPAAVIAWRLRMVTAAGAVAGGGCAVAIYLGTYLAGIAVLGTALLATALSTRYRIERKSSLGMLDEPGGQRDAANVVANCGVAGAGGLLTAFTSLLAGEPGAVLVVTAIAAGASDTVASEVGKARRARARAFPSFRVVPPGTPGAVSIIGTMAGIAAAAVIAWPAVVLWLLSPERVALVAGACTCGAFVESAMATAFERRGVVGNNTLNVINTATAAAIATWWVQ